MKTLNTNLETQMETQNCVDSDIKTSTSGLISRMNMNVKNELKNYDQWVQETILSYYGDSPKFILDVGCGVGKQTHLLQNLYKETHITCVDKSSESLEVLKSNHPKFGLSLVCADIDSYSDYLIKEYDIILSSYAIYYSKNLQNTLLRYRENINDRGVLFLFGYGKKSNHELIDLINGSEDNEVPYYDNFISSHIVSELEKVYTVSIENFENKISFKTANDFNHWFQSCELYQKCNNHNILKMIENIIQSTGEFLLTKETIGYILHPKHESY